MEFEYDPHKSQSNKEKHGIDFEAAQTLWADPRSVEIGIESETEARYLVIAKLEGKHWSAVITYRSNRVRIISVRRSRQDEVAIYESRRN